MLTKKHFKAVAEIIKNGKIYDGDGDECYESMMSRGGFAEDFARYFATQNPRFDRDKFMKACGLGD